MYEDLEALRPDLQPMFGKLKSATPEAVIEMKKLNPECPEAYWTFVRERGTGIVEQHGEPFFFEERLRSAEYEIYCDRLIYDHGAKGDVMIFGHESMGSAYGFDTVDRWRLVEVDQFRVVTPLKLSFYEFVVGLVLCYPQIAVTAHDGEWLDGVGRRYRPGASSFAL